MKLCPELMEGQRLPLGFSRTSWNYRGHSFHFYFLKFWNWKIRFGWVDGKFGYETARQRPLSITPRDPQPTGSPLSIAKR
jgi:hypothetical protein